MGGCAAAQAVGWSALCGAVGIAGQAQGWVDRVAGAAQSVTALGPLQAGLVLVAGLVALALGWQVFLVLAQILFRVYPYAIALGLAILLFAH